MPGSESPKPRPTRAVLASFVVALAGSSIACAGSAKDLALVRDELTKVQRDHDALAKRVFDLEAREALHQEGSSGSSASEKADPTGATSAASSSADEPAPKPLKVVKLAPTPAVMAAEPVSSASSDEDDGPRPSLEIGPSGIKQSEPDASPSMAKGKKPAASKTPAFEPAAAKDYDAAFALVKAKKHSQALDAFAGFLVRYPDHPYAANALFWRGECYYALADFTGAIGQYEALIARFPASAKTADGLLKLGFAHRKLGAAAKANEAFARLRKEFPTSEAAKKIPPEDAS